MSDEEFTKIVTTKKKHLNERDRREAMRPKCCADEKADSFGDCDSFNWPKGPAMNAFLRFGEDNNQFYTEYLEAWKIATDNGW